MSRREGMTRAVRRFFSEPHRPESIPLLTGREKARQEAVAARRQVKQLERPQELRQTGFTSRSARDLNKRKPLLGDMVNSRIGGGLEYGGRREPVKEGGMERPDNAKPRGKKPPKFSIRDMPFKDDAEIMEAEQEQKLRENVWEFCQHYGKYGDNDIRSIIKNREEADTALAFIVDRDKFSGLDNFEDLLELAEDVLIRRLHVDWQLARFFLTNYDKPELPVHMERLEDAVAVAQETIEQGARIDRSAVA